MNAKEVCKYITELEQKYKEACEHRQEAVEIFNEILCQDLEAKALSGEMDDAINDWINKVPHMCSSKAVKNVFKID